MASGKVHDRASKWVAIATGIIASMAADDIVSVMEVVLATISVTWLWGLYLSPDLDLANTKSACNAKHRWSRLRLGWYWVPYGLASKHRGLSHWPLLGTFTRFIYGLWPIVVVCACLGVDQELLLFIFTCGCVSDCMHLLLDQA